MIDKNTLILQVTDMGLEPTIPRLIKSKYNGKMIRYDNQNIDFSVTPNHDMITTIGRMEAKVLMSISQYRAKHIKIPRVINNNNKDVNVNDNQVMLAAAFLCDGTLSSASSFVIKVSKQKKITFLNKLGEHFLSVQSLKKEKLQNLLGLRELSGHKATMVCIPINSLK